MVGTFKANIPYNNFLLLLYGFILKLPMFISPQKPVVVESDAILYKVLLQTLESAGKNFPLLYSILAFLLLYFQAIGLNKLVNNQRLLPKPNYLTGMSFLLITSVFPGWYGLSAPLFALSFYIWLLPLLCNLHNNPDVKTMLFNVGLASGIATLFYFPSVAFLILMFAAIAVTRTFKLTEWLIALLGALAPYYFQWAWMFLKGNFNREDYLPDLSFSIPAFLNSRWEWVGAIFILCTATIGFVLVQNNMRRLLVQSRKAWAILYLYMIVAVAIPFLNVVPGFSAWMFTAIPLASSAAAAFYFPDRKWFSFVMHWGIVIISLLTGFFYVYEKVGA